jgi:hypothetical protein
MKYTFYRCTSLTSITVDLGNPNYASEGGGLYSKVNGNILHILPSGKSGNVTIPKGVTSIMSGNIMGWGGLTLFTAAPDLPA